MPIFPDGMTVRDLMRELQDMCEHEPGRADWVVTATGNYRPRKVTQVRTESVPLGAPDDRRPVFVLEATG